MSFYVIGPPAETTWSLSAEEFVAMLANAFPASRVTGRGESSVRSVIVTVGSGPTAAQVAIDEAGTGIYLEGAWEDVVEIAVAIRRSITPSQPLVLADDTASIYVPLDPGVTSGSLAAQAR